LITLSVVNALVYYESVHPSIVAVNVTLRAKAVRPIVFGTEVLHCAVTAGTTLPLKTIRIIKEVRIIEKRSAAV
jgi:hypothetical protein